MKKSMFIPLVRNRISKTIWISFLIFSFGCNSEEREQDQTTVYDLVESKEKVENSNIATMDFSENKLYDFGTLNAGEKVSHTFKFVNKGNIPLIIQSVAPSCGCTIADYSKRPIPPNSEGFIKATFRSTVNDRGKQNKVITINSNSNDSPILISLIGTVK